MMIPSNLQRILFQSSQIAASNLARDRRSNSKTFNLRIKRRTLLASLFISTAFVTVACGDRWQQQAISASSSPAASNGPNTTVRIAWLKSPSVLSLAKLNGSLEAALKSQGIRVEWVGPFPAFSPAAEAMNAGSVDLTTGSSTAAASSMAGDAPIKIFAYQNSSPAGEGIITRGDSSIQNIRDLVGKKVAVNRGGTGEYLLARALEKEGIPLNLVERVYLGPADAGPAFAQGKVDAWAVWGSFLATAETEYKGRVIASGGDIGSKNDIIHVVRTGFLEQHPDVVKSVYEVLKQQSKSASNNPTEALAAYGKTFKLSPSVVNLLSKRIEKPLASIDVAELNRISTVIDWFFQKGIIPKKPDVANFVVDIKK